MRTIAVILALGLMAGGSAIASKGNKVPVAKPLGEARSCVPITSLRESRVRSDKVIDFRTAGNKWYRNELPHSCPSLAFEERFSYRTSLSQLCSTDIIRVLRSEGGHLREGAGCGLGKFQPVEIAKR
jgi:hypothetical protein